MITKTYLIHPYESVGTIKKNRADEQRIVEELEEMGSTFYLVRPFKLINPHVRRRRAMKKCMRLLDKCRSVLLTGDWIHSKGCRTELEHAIKDDKDIYEYKDGKIIHHIDKGFLNDFKR